MKRNMCLIFAIIILVSVIYVPVFGEEADVVISDSYIENEVVYVPVVAGFEALGITMTEISDGVFKGFGKNGPITIEVGKSTVEVDWVDIELPAVSKYVNGVAMVPAYILEDAAYTSPAEYDSASNTVRVTPKTGNGLYKNTDTEVDFESIIKTLPSGTEIVGNSKIVNLSNSPLVTITYESDYTNITTEEYEFDELTPMSDIQVGFYTSAEIKAGEVSLMTFEARLNSVENDEQSASISVMYQRLPDWIKSLGEKIEMKNDGEWHKFYLPVYSAYYDMPKGSSMVVFAVGGLAKSMDIRNISLVNYGNSISIDTFVPSEIEAYKGIEDEAIWRREALKRIEKYRKADVEISVKDDNGNPVSGANIDIKQTENEFMFGLAAMIGEVVRDEGPEPDYSLSEDLISNSMNTIVPSDVLKPPAIKPDDGTNAIKFINNIISRGKRARGHTLMWDLNSEMWPIDNYRNISYEELYRQVMDYVLPTAYAFRGKLEQWDVLNEPLNCNWLRKEYGTRLYSDVFRRVHEIDPDTKLYINEAAFAGVNSEKDEDMSKKIAEMALQMKREGAHIDGIGIQGHFGKYSYPQGFYHQLDNCAAVVDEITVTEYDLKHPLEEYADEFLRDILIATYSHPKAKGFIVWQYYDNRHWLSSSVFYEEDWSEKPAKAVWDKMVNEDFMTNTNTSSDELGRADFRGYYGDYEITVQVDGKNKKFPFKLSADVQNKIDVTVLENDISYSVSCEPDEPESLIKYNNIREAEEELRKIKPYLFEGIVLEKRPGIEVSKEQNGTVSNEISGQIYETADLVYETILSTYSTRADSVAELLIDKESDCISIGKIVNSDGGYHIEAIDGRKISLNDNSDYRIEAVLSDKIEKGIIEYRVYNGNEILAAHTVVSENFGLTDVTGTTVNINSSSDVSSFLIDYLRIKYISDEDLIFYSDTDSRKYVFMDGLSNFDFSEVVYNSSDSEYLKGDAWLASSQNADKLFGVPEYKWSGKYLWGIRNNENLKKQSLKKKFQPDNASNNLHMEFELYCYAPGVWYDAPGYVSLSLANTDESVTKQVFKYYYDKYYGSRFFPVNIDSPDDENSFWIANNGVTDFNRNSLNAIFELNKNDAGYYDANLVVTNYTGKEIVNYTAENYISEDDYKKIDNVMISSYSASGGSGNYGDAVCGIKNISIYRPNESFATDEEGNILVNGSVSAEIAYENVSGREKDVALLIGAYKDGRLEKMVYKNAKIPSVKMGSIGFFVEDLGVDYYKVFLLKNLENMVPCKSEDTVIIK